MVAAFGSNGTYGTAASGAIAQMAVPPGVLPADIILAWLWKASTAVVTPAAGFTEVTGSPVSTTTSVQSLHLFWKRASGADTGTYDFSWTGSVTREFIASRYVRCAGDGADPFDFAPTLIQRSTTGTVTPGVSGTTANDNSLLVWQGAHFTVPTWTHPSGWSAIIGSNRMAGDVLLQAAAGATGTITGSTDTSQRQMAALVSLRSAVDIIKPRHNFLAAAQRASYY